MVNMNTNNPVANLHNILSNNAMADYSCDISTEGAVSVEPSGSYILFQGGNNETHAQVLLGSPQNSEDQNVVNVQNHRSSAAASAMQSETPNRGGGQQQMIQTDGENEGEAEPQCGVFNEPDDADIEKSGDIVS